MQFLLVSAIFVLAVGSAFAAEYPIVAVVTVYKNANFTATKSPVSIVGTVTFEQADAAAPVKISGQLTGLSPGKHGFHIHALGDLLEGCGSAGGHLNPAGVDHGGPTDKVRHVGDLGNIEANAQGAATIDINDTVVRLNGENSIIGRALVVHVGEDDLGKGTGAAEQGSKTTGNAGKRFGCGVVGIQSDKYRQTREAIAKTARAVIFASDNSKVLGSVFLRQTDGKIEITGTTSGLSAGEHGFHIHALGALGDGCKAATGHFNPDGVNHGGPTDAVRHVGDLGNIKANGEGVADFNLTDRLVTLKGYQSVLGRAIVVHAGVDDLGKGVGAAKEGSLKTGNAGARIGCGVIGVVEEQLASSAVRSSASALTAMAVAYGVMAIRRP